MELVYEILGHLPYPLFREHIEGNPRIPGCLMYQSIIVNPERQYFLKRTRRQNFFELKILYIII